MQSERQELASQGQPIWVMAPLWARLMAHLVDSFLALLLVLVALPIRHLGITAGLVGLTVSLGYYVLAGLPGVPSLGKRLLKMRVFDDGTWKPAGAGQDLVRNLMRLLGPIDWLPIFGQDRQRLGDHLARTVVVYDLFA